MKFEAPKFVRGPQSVIDKKTGKVAGAIEGEELRVLKASAGQTARAEDGELQEGQVERRRAALLERREEGRDAHAGTRSAGDRQVRRVGRADDGRRLRHRAVRLDDKPLGESLDLYNSPDVITTGVLKLGRVELKEGTHHLSIKITGANPAAVQKFMVGLDYLLLEPAK